MVGGLWLVVSGGYWVVGGWWFVVRGWWLVVGGLWLAVGGWLLVVCGWRLVVGRFWSVLVVCVVLRLVLVAFVVCFATIVARSCIGYRHAFACGGGGGGGGGGGLCGVVCSVICCGNAGVRKCVIELCFYVLMRLCCYVGIATCCTELCHYVAMLVWECAGDGRCNAVMLLCLYVALRYVVWRTKVCCYVVMWLC